MKIFLESIGCRLNQSEIEKIASQFQSQGHEIVDNATEADLVVVNTCAVTAAASADSRSIIRNASKNGHARIIATGCYATIDSETIGTLPGVNLLVANQEKDFLVNRVLELPDTYAIPLQSRQMLPGKHKRTRAFIKIQDGCDNFCTYCITRIARGKSISLPEKLIFNDIRLALESGAKEIVLTGVNLGAWGKEFEKKKDLPYLIHQIVKKFSPPRIRLSSIEPWDIEENFLEVLNLPGFCQHLHLPLQSGSDATLKRMGRRITTSDFQYVLDLIRKSFPDIAITTDVIVGFPGESEKDFLKSLEFIRKMSFAGGHIFSFSVRSGTVAENMPEQIPSHIKKNRSKIMRDEIRSSALNYRKKFFHKEVSVLWEKTKYSKGIWSASGFSENYFRVDALFHEDLYNQITKVMIFGQKGLNMRARIIQQ